MSERVNDQANLILHRLIARKLARRPELLVQASDKLSESDERELFVVEVWREILKLDMLEVRRLLCERYGRMDRLRLTIPFVSLVDLSDPDLRKRIYRLAARGV